MENKTLAILGHPTRGKEVIEILEMLGGKNKFNFKGNEDEWLVLNGNIQRSDRLFAEKGFTLEEFLEKYPYKVGDKVKNARTNDFIGRITNVRWDGDEKQIIYVVEWDDVNKSTLTYFATGLQPYKEEIWTYYANDDDSKTDITIDGEKLIAPRGYTVKNATTNGNSLIVEYIKNKPQYPKTYNECCNVLRINPKSSNDAQGYKADDIIHFQELLIARDAYWKIAGEEMGLSESWKPDWKKADERKYCIVNSEGNITIWVQKTTNKILAFPTEEMRDAFFENFKDLIEKCKEFL